ncbi:Methyltransf_16 domain-containing protein [Cephalotus follicularis]|uniref:Methyltransf_16 domain-containing protein n=1 Tax=Cephalotus follicularis TaxID=3775 RepID=A0A1Q3CD01_CEPFO|nr:Methyltransf_16 domain-containing protein [Cephalotus follicularis]
MAEQGLDPETPPGLHLVSAFLSMEPTDSLISLARACGGSAVTVTVQRFIWDHCINKPAGKGHASHMKNFLKKLIVEVESNYGDVLDELYAQYAAYMASFKDNDLIIGNARACKCISFLFPDGCFELPTCPKSRKLVVPLQCSLNMLAGDTGCSIWPSSLFLSEFVLSFPDIFSGKSCFEVGSGVGLAGICLAHAKASKVILTDGDLSSLANMKLNLELNQLRTYTDVLERATGHPRMVKCLFLPWESASEYELHDFMPDIILGADVIYDPSCLPHLVRVLAILLHKVDSCPQIQKGGDHNSLLDNKCVDGQVNGANKGNLSDSNAVSDGKCINECGGKAIYNAAPKGRSREHPVAYIASVIRNIGTFNYFLALADEANLRITDQTKTLRPCDLLPYMQSYDRSSIRLFTVLSK